MRVTKEVTALFASCAMVLAACGGAEEDNVSDSATGSTPVPAPAPAPAPAVASATLYWSASPDSSVTGYRVYYGTTSRTYQAKGSGLNASSATTYVVPNLTVGRTYYFAVTAYDSAGNESDFSAEATKTAQ